MRLEDSKELVLDHCEALFGPAGRRSCEEATGGGFGPQRRAVATPAREARGETCARCWCRPRDASAVRKRRHRLQSVRLRGPRFDSLLDG
jgi:hypothetical protein